MTISSKIPSLGPFLGTAHEASVGNIQPCVGFSSLETWFHLALQIKARLVLLDFPVHLDILIMLF